MTYLTFHLCALRKSYHLSQEQWVVRQGVPQVTLMVKNLPDNAKDGRDMGLIPGSGRSPGGGHGSPLHVVNTMDSSMENHLEEPGGPKFMRLQSQT